MNQFLCIKKFVKMNGTLINSILVNFESVKNAHCGKTRNSPPCKIFSPNQSRVRFFSIKLLSRNFCERMVAVLWWRVCVEITESQCGNYGNSLSHIFGKNFVRPTHLLKKLLLLIFLRCKMKQFVNSACLVRTELLWFWQKFCESNSFEFN